MLADCVDLAMNEAVSLVAGLSLVSHQEEGSGMQQDKARKERSRQKLKHLVMNGAVSSVARLSLAGTQQDQARKEKQRQKSKLSRDRIFFEKQIEKLTSGLPVTFRDMMALVWVGDMKDGRWTAATQLTPMGKVKTIGTVGKRAKYFHGAIVTFGDKKDRRYSSISKKYFKIPRPCHAKYEVFTTAKEYPAMMWTDPCFNEHGGTPYTFVDYGRWEKNREHRKWVHSGQVREFGESTPRSTKSPDYYSPRTTRARKIGYSYIKESAYRKNATEEGMYYKLFSWMSGIPENATKEDIEFFSKYFSQEDQTIHRQNNAPRDVPKLFLLADQKWQLISFTRNKEKGLAKVAPKKSPKSPLIELSLIYQIIRGDLRATIGKQIDDALSVCHHEPTPYLSAIAQFVGDCNATERSLKLGRRWQKRRAICKVDKCMSYVHLTFAKDGVCYKHAAKEKKKLCSVCQKNQQVRTGGLCHACFKKSTNDTNPSKPRFWCSNCRVRKSRINGGMCPCCIGNKIQ
jgi:hypothetical protein